MCVYVFYRVYSKSCKYMAKAPGGMRVAPPHGVQLTSRWVRAVALPPDILRRICLCEAVEVNRHNG